MNLLKSMTALCVLFSACANTYANDGCDPSVQEALDKQREAYIVASAGVADQNFSKRPSTFSKSTCLDDLMLNGGTDILFKPPSLTDILGQVTQMACDEANKILEELTNISDLGDIANGSLNPGELIPGVNLGDSLGSIEIDTSGSSNGSGQIIFSLGDLFQ
ncbi:hypothetical protein [Flexibacterium corallicola]|uniref:hypothetical protein n=1 Tax=Flexibacterium corallicola TaxID=3037259 RepID=UPI00286EC501|nr:hypothetical protein [Pseudovibrio sp. M1P-2-3]